MYSDILCGIPFGIKTFYLPFFLAFLGIPNILFDIPSGIPLAYFLAFYLALILA